MADTPRPARPQAVLEVLGKSRITPRLVRVTLGGPGIADLSRNDSTDAYVKLVLPLPGTDLEPPYDMDTLRAERPDILPVLRTYTVRSWDHDAQRLSLDVVMHGDGELDGIAAQWADGALPGDRVAARGAGGGYAPDPQAAFHLLIGDHSALPAIARSLEEMDAAARGVALIQLDHAEDRLPLTVPEGVEVQWIIAPRAELVAAVRDLDLPAIEGLQVFAHGERGIIKEIRRHLVREREIPKEQISISAYWALGRIEDQFQAEKREPVGRIDD